MTPQLRRQIIQGMPNLIADSYESPRKNLQAILTRLVENVSDIQRRPA